MALKNQDIWGPTVAPFPTTASLNGAAVGLVGVSKVYDPQPRWMRLFSRTSIREPIVALRDVSFDVQFGDILAVVGPNGAGKTTIFRIIVGLTTATTGRVTVAGLDVTRRIDDVRQIVGWMSAEERSLLMRATCRENLQLHGRLQGWRPPRLSARIDEVLELVGLASKRDAIVASLSAGMKARLRLARALLPRPVVLLLDEPTGALDPLAAHGLLNLVMDLARNDGLAVLLSSHRLEEIDALRSNAILMDRGEVRFRGSLDELRRRVEIPALELFFTTAAAARAAEERIRGAASEIHLDGVVLRIGNRDRLPAGEILGFLGPLLPEVRRVSEVTTPLRDVIASVYDQEGDDRDGF